MEHGQLLASWETTWHHQKLDLRAVNGAYVYGTTRNDISYYYCSLQGRTQHIWLNFQWGKLVHFSLENGYSWENFHGSIYNCGLILPIDKGIIYRKTLAIEFKAMQTMKVFPSNVLLYTVIETNSTFSWNIWCTHLMKSCQRNGFTATPVSISQKALQDNQYLALKVLRQWAIATVLENSLHRNFYQCQMDRLVQ